MIIVSIYHRQTMSYSLKAGKTLDLNTKHKGIEILSVENEDVAKYSGTVITGVTAGTTTLNVLLNDIYYECKITVK